MLGCMSDLHVHGTSIACTDRKVTLKVTLIVRNPYGNPNPNDSNPKYMKPKHRRECCHIAGVVDLCTVVPLPGDVTTCRSSVYFVWVDLHSAGSQIAAAAFDGFLGPS